MDIKKYLSRIKYNGDLQINLQTLTSLHTNHLLNIPFENLDIHLGRKIVLDPELICKKIVLDKRGGFCYEMNGLFYEVLIDIGFKAKMVSARVYDSAEPGQEFDHLAIIITIENNEFLADVGFGDSFMEPLKLEPGVIQKQGRRSYKIEIIDDMNYIVKYSEDGTGFNNMYRFSAIQRQLSEFSKMCEYHQSSPESHFTRKRMCTIAKPEGRITISGLKLTETLNGIKTEIPLKSEIDFNDKLNQLFGINWDNIK